MVNNDVCDDRTHEPLEVRASCGKPEAIAVMIGQLGFGGSERQFHLFLSFCNRTRWEPVVYVSGSLGYWADPIRKLGIPIILLRGSRLAKMWKFRNACIEQNARCFFSWSSYTNGFGFALFGRGVRRIGSFRNVLFQDLPERPRWFWSWLSTASISTIVCNSRETQVQAARHVGSAKRVVYVPNAVEIFPLDQVQEYREQWRARLGLPNCAVLVLGVGGLRPQKNFARFIDVIERVRQRVSVHAVVAGEDQGCLADLLKQLARPGVQRSVQLIGAVPDARELMCAADIFLLSSDHEGMPNVVMEAMAAGVPCVSTPVSGVRDLIEESVSGFIATASVADLAQHVIRLSEDVGLRRAVGAHARAVIERRFRPEQIIHQLWALCE
jgi:glycosyltransferase involved in cell wall biosynthesis